MFSKVPHLNASIWFALQRKPAVPLSEGILYLPVERITHLRSEGCYTYVFCHDGQYHLTCERLGWLERRLPPEIFFRCHHSFVVNLAQINKVVRGDAHKAVLECGASVLVSRRKLKALICAMNKVI